MRRRSLGIIAIVAVLGIGAYLAFDRYWYYLPGLLAAIRDPIQPNHEVAWERGPDVAAAAPADRPPNIVLIVADDLGWNDIKLTAPVFAGDTLYAESEVIAKRESQSRPTQGIVTVKTRGLNQDNKVVIAYERAILVPKRGYSVEDL